MTKCDRCGLPMSYCDQPANKPAQLVCDGPNDNTSREGCGHATEVK